MTDVGKISKRFPIGHPVRYWPVKGASEFIDATICSEPWILGHGAIVIKITGKTGGVSVDHLKEISSVRD